MFLDSFLIYVLLPLLLNHKLGSGFGACQRHLAHLEVLGLKETQVSRHHIACAQDHLSEVAAFAALLNGESWCFTGLRRYDKARGNITSHDCGHSHLDFLAVPKHLKWQERIWSRMQDWRGQGLHKHDKDWLKKTRWISSSSSTSHLSHLPVAQDYHAMIEENTNGGTNCGLEGFVMIWPCL